MLSIHVPSCHDFMLGCGLTETTSTPCLISFCPDSFELSRVIPRILYFLKSQGSSRMVLMPEPPWLPVAPNTVIIFDNQAPIQHTYLPRKRLTFFITP